MSNPWNLSVLQLAQSFIRFALWFMLAINSAMLAVFSVCVLYKVLTFTWDWLIRTWFTKPW